MLKVTDHLSYEQSHFCTTVSTFLTGSASCNAFSYQHNEILFDIMCFVGNDTKKSTYLQGLFRRGTGSVVHFRITHQIFVFTTAS